MLNLVTSSSLHSWEKPTEINHFDPLPQYMGDWIPTYLTGYA
jgi:hypothetical protein